MRKKMVSSQNDSSMQSYEKYQRTLNIQGNYANPGDRPIPENDDVVFVMNGQHDGMDMEG